MSKLYRHYKGDLYEVLFEDSLHTETSEHLVIYRKHNSIDNTIYVRPKDMFFSTITDGLQRFTFVDEINKK